MTFADQVLTGYLKSQHDLFVAITSRAVQRVRPKLMTVSMITLGLVPALCAHGAGAETIQRPLRVLSA